VTSPLSTFDIAADVIDVASGRAVVQDIRSRSRSWGVPEFAPVGSAGLAVESVGPGSVREHRRRATSH
jgi:hypothetical protein